MYLPKAFAEHDPNALWALIERHSFGTLVVTDERGGLELAELPFLPDRARDRILVHVARANPIWRMALTAHTVVAVFRGPHGYVSPRWYQSPDESVPTWNYAVVHAHCRAEGPLPDDQLAGLLDALTARYEGGSGWDAGRLPPELRQRLHQEIAAVSLSVERLEGKFKLSGNRSAEDQARVRAALRARGTPDDLAMVALMELSGGPASREPGA